jgi:hypothetical protein
MMVFLPPIVRAVPMTTPLLTTKLHILPVWPNLLTISVGDHGALYALPMRNKRRFPTISGNRYQPIKEEYS